MLFCCDGRIGGFFAAGADDYGMVLGAQVKARTPDEQFRQLMRTCVQSVELKEAETFEDAYYYLMSGFCVFVLDGCPRAMVMGIQGLDQTQYRRAGERKQCTRPKSALWSL